MSCKQRREIVVFPEFKGIRCLMMPFIQGEPMSVPRQYASYDHIIESLFLRRGEIGFLTIDESLATKGKPHRGERAKYGRAIHTEAGKHPYNNTFKWGWGKSARVTLDRGVKILLANSLDDSCAIWDMEHENTSLDGDIGDFASMYPYAEASMLKAGAVYEIGILTPHESLPVKEDCQRQFLRIMSSGIHGRENYFTENPLVPF